MFYSGNILRRKIFVNVSKSSDPDFGLKKLKYTTRFRQIALNLHVILYLSTCHTVYISVLIFFMFMS